MPKRAFLYGLLTLLLGTGCASLAGGGIQSKASWDVWLEPVKKAGGLTLDDQNRLYISSEAESGTVWRSDAQGQMTLFALHLKDPDGLLFDPQSKALLVSLETNAGKVISLDLENGRQTLLIEDLQQAEGLALDSGGRLYIAEDRPGGRILRWDKGKIETWLTGLDRPENLAIDRNDYVYVSETGTARVLQIATDGYRRILNREMNKPDGMTYCSAYNTVLVSEDVPHGRIFYLRPNGAAGVIASGLKFPQGMVCDAEGSLFVAESGRNRILHFAAAGLQPLLNRKPAA